MSEESKFYLMLPTLVEEGLIEDDSADYSLTAYPREIISNAAITVVTDFENRKEEVDTSSMKRIDTTLEFMAVALSLPMKYTNLMITSRNIIRKWIENPQMFGDVETKNIYARRIVKHLSLIFAMREPDAEILKTSFNSLANTVLNDIKYFHTTDGQWFDKETWITTMNVLIGICDSLLNFDFQNIVSKSDVSKLRQKAIETYFSTIQLSGLRDDCVWKLFTKYCYKWTIHFDFIRIWGRVVSKLFVYLNLRIYKPDFETQQQLFQEGSYSAENQITSEMVGFIFHQFAFALDQSKLTEGSPELLKEFATSLSQVAESAQAIGDFTSDFFMKRFPGIPFLKTFGPFFTFAPLLPENYDESTAIIVSSIVSIISNFQFDDNDRNVLRYLSYVIRRASPEHMLPLAMFLNGAFTLYRHNTNILPYISKYSLTMLPKLNLAKAARIVNDAFFQSCTSLFISATESLINQQDITSKYQDAFNMIWKNITRSDVQYQLLAYASKLEINVFEKISLFFEESAFKQMTTDSSNVPFINALIYLICVMTRVNPQGSSNKINEYNLVSKIITNVITTDSSRLENYDSLMCATLQFVVTTIEWGVDIYNTKEILTVVFQLIEYARTALHKFKKGEKDKNKGKKEKSKDSYKWVEKDFTFIKSTIDDISGKINIHLPSKDFFTRRANSYIEVNEESIAKQLGLKEHTTRYFGAQHHVLLSFTENNDGTGPLILISRGPHGKAVFVVKENLKLGSADPEIADIIKSEDLPPVEALKCKEPIITDVDDLQLPNTIKDVEIDDDAMRTVYATSFNQWLEISKLHYVPSLTKKQPYKRPRVIDFVTEMGYCIGKDTYALRTYNNLDAVHEAIRQIDLTDTAFFTPVVITHILQSDNSLTITEGFNRMSPLMAKFLHEIAEPMEISDSIAETSGLPLLRTPVPVIPLVRGYIAFISEALTKNELEATKVCQLDPLVKIVFNETDYGIKIDYEKKPSSLLLVVRPKGNGLYHVTQSLVPATIFSPFAPEQVLTARALAFNITCCIEQLSHTQTKLYPRSAHQKDKIIHELETKFGNSPTPLTIVNEFK